MRNDCPKLHLSSLRVSWGISLSLLASCGGEDRDSTRVVELPATPAPEPEGAPDGTVAPEPTVSAPALPAEPETPAAGESIEPGASPAAPRFVLASITIDAEGRRVSYAQVVDELSGHFDNSNAIEAP